MLNSVTKCMHCTSSNLAYDSSLEIDWTEDDSSRVVEAKVCQDCDTIHFVQDGCLARQITHKREVFSWVKQVNDCDLHLHK